MNQTSHFSPQQRVQFATLWLVLASCCCSCVTYRVQTKKLEGTEYQQQRVKSLFWGILQTPKIVTTPICDSLGSPGMSEVFIRRNFGDYVLSTVTIGIYNPATLKWKCSKPCPQTGTL